MLATSRARAPLHFLVHRDRGEATSLSILGADQRRRRIQDSGPPGPATLSQLAAFPGLALCWDFSSRPRPLLMPSWGQAPVGPALWECLFWGAKQMRSHHRLLLKARNDPPELFVPRWPAAVGACSHRRDVTQAVEQLWALGAVSSLPSLPSVLTLIQTDPDMSALASPSPNQK